MTRTLGECSVVRFGCFSDLICFLVPSCRYDDTNPLAETQDFIDSQAENVAWMGYKPFKTTFSSNYFPKL